MDHTLYHWWVTVYLLVNFSWDINTVSSYLSVYLYHIQYSQNAAFIQVNIFTQINNSLFTMSQPNPITSYPLNVLQGEMKWTKHITVIIRLILSTYVTIYFSTAMGFSILNQSNQYPFSGGKIKAQSMQYMHLTFLMRTFLHQIIQMQFIHTCCIEHSPYARPSVHLVL